MAPILILNWNGWEDTFECLRSVRDSGDADEVWLVDNGSAEDKSGECLQILPGLRVMKLGENFGWAGGYNRALKIAAAEGYEFAFLLNNDSVVCPGFLKAASDSIRNDSRLAAVGSVILFGSERDWIKFDGEYHSPGQKRYLSGASGKVFPSKDVNGAGMLVRLTALEKDGYFDERFFCYWEERDWCWRLASRGWRFAISKDSVVYHQGERSNINANARYYRARNRFLVLDTHKNQAFDRSRFGLIVSLLVEARQLWLCGDAAGYMAILSALHDGNSGRFGKRSDRAASFIWRIVGGAHARFGWLRRKVGFRTRLRRSLVRLTENQAV